MKLLIDGKDIRDMSIDQIGATLQQVASELSIRGNDSITHPDRFSQRTLLWSFEKVHDVAELLRKLGRTR